MTMKEELIELVGSVDVANDIQKRIKAVGVRGLDFEKAKELGLFTRISNLLCATHASIMAAYRIYCGVSKILYDFGGRKNEINREMNIFEKAYERFSGFWTGYYAHGVVSREVNEEAESLFLNIMEWTQLPLEWNLGDSQRVQCDDFDISLKIDQEEKTYYFRKTVLESKLVGNVRESWCVTRYDSRTNKQTTVEENMDKASAMMVAKRLSSEDTENIYTASIIHEYVEKVVDVTPFKAYMHNETVGKITKTK